MVVLGELQSFTVQMGSSLDNINQLLALASTNMVVVEEWQEESHKSLSIHPELKRARMK